MTNRQRFKTLLTDFVEPVLVAQGFDGTWRRGWTKRSHLGDYATVQAQSSSIADDTFLFRVHLAVLPRPRWEWSRGQAVDRRPPTTLDGTWRMQLKPAVHWRRHRGGRWWLVTDDRLAGRCGRDAAWQLASVGVPLLTRLLDRGDLTAVLATGDVGGGNVSVLRATLALAIIAADEGRTNELDRHSATLAAQGRPGLADDPWIRARIADRLQPNTTLAPTTAD